MATNFPLEVVHVGVLLVRILPIHSGISLAIYTCLIAAILHADTWSSSCGSGPSEPGPRTRRCLPLAVEGSA